MKHGGAAGAAKAAMRGRGFLGLASIFASPFLLLLYIYCSIPSLSGGHGRDPHTDTADTYSEDVKVRPSPTGTPICTPLCFPPLCFPSSTHPPVLDESVLAAPAPVLSCQPRRNCLARQFRRCRCGHPLAKCAFVVVWKWKDGERRRGAGGGRRSRREWREGAEERKRRMARREKSTNAEMARERARNIICTFFSCVEATRAYPATPSQPLPLPPNLYPSLRIDPAS